MQKTLISSPPNVAKAFSSGTPIEGISQILVHYKPHADELAAIAVLRLYGETRFPGIKKASIMLATQARIREDFGDGDTVWVEMVRQGILPVGTGGGPLDDHDTGGRKDASALDRVVKFLEIDNLPEIQHLLTYINYEDSNGERGNLVFKQGEGTPELHQAFKQFMFATIIKRTWRVCEEDESADFARLFVRQFEIQLEDERNLRQAIPEVLGGVEYRNLPHMTTKKSEIPVLAIIRSDNNYAKDVLLQHNGRPNLVAILQIRSSGNFQLYSVGRRSRFDDVARMIRGEIILHKNKTRNRYTALKNDWKTAATDGATEEVPEIFYFRAENSNMIFNGSLTQEDTPPTIGHFFSEAKLLWLVSVGLRDKMFENGREKICRSGSCTARNNPCQLYNFGLPRCRSIRYLEHAKA